MFNFAWSEILVVAVIAIIVVGPKELPGMLRTFGRFFGQARRMAREVQTQFNDMVREAERQADLEGVREGIDKVKSMNPASQLKKSLSEVKKDLDTKVDDKPMPQPGAAPVEGAETATNPATKTAALAAAAADEPASAHAPASGGNGQGRTKPAASADGRAGAGVEDATTPEPADVERLKAS